MVVFFGTIPTPFGNTCTAVASEGVSYLMERTSQSSLTHWDIRVKTVNITHIKIHLLNQVKAISYHSVTDNYT